MHLLQKHMHNSYNVGCHNNYVIPRNVCFSALVIIVSLQVSVDTV